MADRKNIEIDQGTDFTVSYDIATGGINIASYTCSGQMRKHHASNTAYNFTCVVDDSNTLTISMSSNTSANITGGLYLYDVIVTSNTAVNTRVVEGMVTVTPRITR